MYADVSRCTSLVAPLLVSILAACSFDAPTEEAPTTNEMQVVLDTAHPALSLFPQVEHLALAEDTRTTFVAGRLGFELDAVSEAFELSDSTLTLMQSDRDQLGFTIERYAQTRDGLDVVGGDLRLTREDDGSIHSASGLSWDPSQEILEADISATKALDTAMGDTEGVTDGSDGRLVYLAPSDGSSPVLVWHFVLTGNRDGMPVVDDVYVDAARGGVVDRSPRVHSARVRSTYNANGQEAQGNLARTENTGNTGDIDVDQAHESAGLTYDCLMTLFTRDSFDNQGQSLTSIANYGVDYRNAFWDGTKMTYGDGMGVPDIGTHEFMHAVTQYTGNMVYQNEPGALNEAWSDIISAVCDANTPLGVTPDTWKLGEDSPLGALRFMDNPTLDGISSDHYDTRYQGTEDEGGVHLNSGIANLAFVLLSQGGQHPQGKSQVQVQDVGITNAGKIFYRALSAHMSTNTDFLGARVATEAAAADLFGAGSSEQISVSEAWQSVGVGGPAPERVEVEPDPEPTDPNDDDGTGTGDGTGDGTGGGGGNGTPQPGTGTVTGGCSAVGTGTSTGFSLLLLLAFAGLFRRRENQ
jgi:uncharacterized protein (TIGR03382 family)